MIIKSTLPFFTKIRLFTGRNIFVTAPALAGSFFAVMALNPMIAFAANKAADHGAEGGHGHLGIVCWGRICDMLASPLAPLGATFGRSLCPLGRFSARFAIISDHGAYF